MSLQLFVIDVQVAGNFNPQIITPDWLVRQAVYPDPSKTAVSLSVENLRDVSFKYEIGGHVWQVSADRLIVGTHQDESPAAAVLRVLNLLPHTPVHAIGNNFRYKAPRESWTGPLPELGTTSKELQEVQGQLGQSSWRSQFVDKSIVLNAEMIANQNEVLVSLNYHRPTDNLDSALDALGKFGDDREASRVWINTVIGEGMIS